MPRLFAATLIAALALTPACQRSAPRAPSVVGAWIRLAAVPGRPAAAYFTVHGSTHPDRLVAVTSPQATSVELHESMADGMRPISGAAVSAGGDLVFAPGGRHAMMFGVAPQVRPGGVVDLRLRLESGRVLDAKARAIAAGDPAPASAH